MPIGTEGYIKNGNNWEVCDSNDGALYSGTGTGSSTANMDAINQSRPGISYNANVESLINYNPGNGKTISDYQPTSNQIIDQGVALLTNRFYIIRPNQSIKFNCSTHSSWCRNRYWCYRWKLTLDSWSSGMDTSAKYKPRRYIL